MGDPKKPEELSDAELENAIGGSGKKGILFFDEADSLRDRQPPRKQVHTQAGTSTQDD